MKKFFYTLIFIFSCLSYYPINASQVPADFVPEGAKIAVYFIEGNEPSMFVLLTTIDDKTGKEIQTAYMMPLLEEGDHPEIKILDEEETKAFLPSIKDLKSFSELLVEANG